MGAKKAPENKKPATRCDSLVSGLQKIRIVISLDHSDCTHPCQPWLRQQQAHGRQFVVRVLLSIA
jgi:hypothetical protein